MCVCVRVCVCECMCVCVCVCVVLDHVMVLSSQDRYEEKTRAAGPKHTEQHQHTGYSRKGCLVGLKKQELLGGAAAAASPKNAALTRQVVRLCYCCWASL